MLHSNSSVEKEKKPKQFVAETPDQLPLVKRNFFWMGVAAVIIVTGFLLMLGSSSGNGEFNPDIFSTRRIVVGPTLAFSGYVLMAIAIFMRPKSNNVSSATGSDKAINEQ